MPSPLAGAPRAAARPDSDAGRLAAAVQRHYDAVKDFRADFTHTYEGGVLHKRTVERGQVAIQKPGRMRWTYTDPEKKVFVSDGTKYYSYIPEDRQVYVATVPAGDQASTAVLFLAGKGDIVRDFDATAATVPGAPADSVALKLTPRRPQREYDWLELVVDRVSLALRMLVTKDSQGGTSTFAFANLRENANIPSKEFVFTMPRGVDVVTDGGR
jgi:outer membrane lipoprotein carrier protein